MGDLDQLIRDGLGLAKAILGPGGILADVMHKARTGLDDANKPTYGSAVRRQAVVEKKTRQIPSQTGIEVVHGADLMFVEPVPIGEGDEITLPDGTKGPVRLLKGLVDSGTGEPYYREVFVGVD